MHIISNLTPNKLVLEGGRYVIPMGGTKVLYEGDEKAPGVISAIIKRWAKVELTDKPLEFYIQATDTSPVSSIAWEEETVGKDGQAPVEEDKPSEDKDVTGKFFEETYNAQGERIAAAAALPAKAESTRKGAMKQIQVA